MSERVELKRKWHREPRFMKVIIYEYREHEDSIVSTMRVLQRKSDFSSREETKKSLRKELKMTRKGKGMSMGRGFRLCVS